MAEKLGSGATLPALTLKLVSGGTTTVPADLTTEFGILLFYRGHW